MFGTTDESELQSELESIRDELAALQQSAADRAGAVIDAGRLCIKLRRRDQLRA